MFMDWRMHHTHDVDCLTAGEFNTILALKFQQELYTYKEDYSNSRMWRQRDKNSWLGDLYSSTTWDSEGADMEICDAEQRHKGTLPVCPTKLCQISGERWPVQQRAPERLDIRRPKENRMHLRPHALFRNQLRTDPRIQCEVCSYTLSENRNHSSGKEFLDLIPKTTSIDGRIDKSDLLRILTCNSWKTLQLKRQCAEREMTSLKPTSDAEWPLECTRSSSCAERNLQNMRTFRRGGRSLQRVVGGCWTPPATGERESEGWSENHQTPSSGRTQELDGA